MPIEKVTLTVPAELEGLRLDQALARLCPQHSRARLQDWIRQGFVRLDSNLPRQRDFVSSGQTIHIEAEIVAAREYTKECIDLDVVYEDESIIVINKPAGLVVHPGAGNPGHTLLNALLFHFPRLAQLPRAGIVQRLDKDTTGLMVIAGTPRAHTFLVEQLQTRRISRHYQALVQGVLTAGGTVDAPIGRHPVQRKQMAVRDSGKSAVTHYRIIRKYAAHTHLLLKLESGRTHQIRVHMAHIRHPIVGDPVYAGRARLPKNCSPALVQTLQNFSRQALHASELGLAHPESGKDLVFKAELPNDFQDLLQELGNE